MLEKYYVHNQFKIDINTFKQADPQLRALSRLKYQYSPRWWQELDFAVPGIYILTGGRQVGKSTSCKLLIQHCMQQNIFSPTHILYLPCDEIFTAKNLSEVIRFYLAEVSTEKFLLIIDEITFVKNWDLVIKALADEGAFSQGVCLLTGSDTLILKDAAMRFPGRRGNAEETDFHLYPLTFAEYVQLVAIEKSLADLFQDYLICGGYLRAINDLAEHGKITTATLATYEQWIRGDFLKQGKNETTLLAILQALLTIGPSQISFSSLNQKIGLISKETCIDYCRMLERMDILFILQAFDPTKKQGFPRKDRKFHFTDPFIYRVILAWLQREGQFKQPLVESTLVEACVASACNRTNKTFYYKGKGEIDVILLRGDLIIALEVKWSNQLRANDLKTLSMFKNGIILTKAPQRGVFDGVACIPVYEYLQEFMC